MTKKERLEEIIRVYGGGKPSLFAKNLGIAPSTISSWLVRDTFDYDLLFAKCESISAEWLLTGRGEMLKTNRSLVNNTPTVSPSEEDKDTKKTTHKQEENTPVARLTSVPGEGIPLIPFEAMAGVLTGEQTVLEYECERYIVPAFTGADFLMPVKGDSMLPTYKSGDLVACKRVPMSERFFQWNKAYVVDTNQGPLIKRIKPAGGSNLYLISDNQDYDPIELPATSIYAVALVIGVIRLE